MKYIIFPLFALAVVLGCQTIGIHAANVTTAVVLASLFSAALAAACGWLLFHRA